MQISYQKELEKQINSFLSKEKVPSLLLHSCCAPCSSYVLEYLSEFFCITVFYDNSNIYPKEEYEKRLSEQEKLISKMSFMNKVSLLYSEYDPKEFYDLTKGMENLKEGSKRCFECYKMRLEHTAKKALELGFDCFTTTLSISPYKNADWINEIGKELQDRYKVEFLYSDFKKKNGYKRSIELSKMYDIYRQHYCGCVYSLNEQNKN